MDIFSDKIEPRCVWSRGFTRWIT